MSSVEQTASQSASWRYATEQLRALINDGDYRPGDRLPPERQLIDSLGLSRSALRKGLDALEREGAIWRHVGKGTFVAEEPTDVLKPDMAALSESVTPVQLMRARVCLEPQIAGEAAANASTQAVAMLRAARDRAVAAPSWDAYEVCDDAFHLAVAEASGNVLLVSLFNHVNHVRRLVTWRKVIRQSDRPPATHSSFAEHDRILVAIEDRDPKAAQDAMHAHLASVSVRLFGRI